MHLKELSKDMQVLVMNADDMQNWAEKMKCSTQAIIKYKGHRELIQFLIIDMHDSDIVLGYNWLRCHNPNIDWLYGTIKLNQCPTQCLLWQKCLKAQLAWNSIKKISVPNDKMAKIKEIIPEEFWEYTDVFSEVTLTQMSL